MSDTATDVNEAEQAFIDSLPDPDAVDDAEDASEAPQPVEAAPDEEGTTEEPPAEADALDDPLAVPDSFTPADVRGMLESISDPEAKAAATAAVRNFQADYTRSKQTLAEQAKTFSGLEDIEKAKAAVEFYDGIQNDPDFAMEVHGYLSKVFEDAGMTPAQAAATATEEMTTPAEAVQTPDFDDDPDAALKAQLDQLNKRVEGWEAQEQERQRQQAEDQLAADLLRQEMAITQANPTLTDTDLNYIYDLAAARGGNLMEAHQQFETMRQDFISQYMDAKQHSVPPTEPSPGAASAPPEPPRLEDGSINMDALHKIAEQRLRNAMAGRD